MKAKTQKTVKPIRETRWIDCWSDPNSTSIARLLRDNGLRAKTTHSIYVGHRGLAIIEADIAKARKLMREQGYSDAAWGFSPQNVKEYKDKYR